MGAALDLKLALETRLAAMSGGLDTAWEGKSFTPTPGTPWQKAHLMTALTEAAGPGVDAFNYHQGTFQVSVFYPANDKGAGPAITQADLVAAWFKRGTRLTHGTTVLVISAAAVGPVLPESVWLQVPVSVQFYAHSLNP